MDRVEPVSAGIRRVGGQVRAEHHTVGVVRTLPGDVNELDCACGVSPGTLIASSRNVKVNAKRARALRGERRII